MSKSTEVIKRPPSQQFPVPVADANDWLWAMAGISKEQRAADFRAVYEGLLAKCQARSRPQTFDSKSGEWTQGHEEDDLLIQLRALEALPAILGLAKNPTVHIHESREGTLPDWSGECIDVTPSPPLSPEEPLGIQVESTSAAPPRKATRRSSRKAKA